MESIKEMVPLSVKREMKHVLNFLLKQEYRNNWKENRMRRQYKTSFGEKNADKTFYIIRRASSGESMGSVWKNCIGELEYADKKGYIPVVDYLHYYDALIQPSDECEKENAWEYYFEQVSSYSLEEVYQSKNVIMANSLDSKHWIYQNQGRRIYTDKRYRSHLASIMRKYCVLSGNMKENIDREYARIQSIIGKNKILGVCVLLREADIVNRGSVEGDLKGRNVQPAYKEVVNDIHRCMREYNCKYVFMSDDSERYRKKLYEEFGNTIIFSNREQIRGDEISVGAGVEALLKIDPRKYTMGYLTDMFLLASCDSILASECSTSQLVCLINNSKFENEKIYHMGTI